MTLRPTDMLVIQSAIDEYEKKYPRRPAPTAEVALTWRLGKREAARMLSRANDTNIYPDSEARETSRLAFAWNEFKSRLDRSHLIDDDTFESLAEEMPWLRGVLLVGGLSAGAVVAVSLFFFGALVGGYK